MKRKKLKQKKFSTQIVVLIISYHLSSKMGLFTLQNCCVSGLIDYLKSQLDFESKSRLPIPKFSGGHFIILNHMSKRTKT